MFSEKKRFILFNLCLLFYTSSLFSQEKTSFFKFTYGYYNPLDIQGLRPYYSADKSIYGTKEGDSNITKINPTSYNFEVKDDLSSKFSLEYWNLQKYNFLIGISQHNSKTKIESTYFATSTTKDLLYKGTNYTLENYGIGRNGFFETKNIDIYAAYPFYFKKSWLLIPKIMKRKHELIFQDNILGIIQGSFKDVPINSTTQPERLVDYSISGNFMNTFALKAKAQMFYKGFILEKIFYSPVSNDKGISLFLDYSISDKSKGNYTLLDFSMEKATLNYKKKTINPELPETDLYFTKSSQEAFDLSLTQGFYHVSGKTINIGLKSFSSKYELFLIFSEETLKVSFSPLFTFYNQFQKIENTEEKINQINPKEYLTDFLIWNQKTTMLTNNGSVINDLLTAGVSYKLHL